jgi:hypothetical protein
VFFLEEAAHILEGTKIIGKHRKGKWAELKLFRTASAAYATIPVVNGRGQPVLDPPINPITL